MWAEGAEVEGKGGGGGTGAGVACEAHSVAAGTLNDDSCQLKKLFSELPLSLRSWTIATRLLRNSVAEFSTMSSVTMFSMVLKSVRGIKGTKVLKFMSVSEGDWASLVDMIMTRRPALLFSP